MDSSESILKRFKRRRHPGLLWRRVFRFWPLMVWLTIAALAVWLYAGTVHYGSITGVVESVGEDIAPIETARLLSVDVVLGQQVRAGDVIARMDTSVLDATLAVEEASALGTTQDMARYQESILRMARQYETAITDTQADYLQELRAQAEAAAELGELRKELERREALLERKLIREEDVTSLRPQIAALEMSAQAYPEIVEAYRQRLETARREYANMRAWLELQEGEDIALAMQRKRESGEILLQSAAALRAAQRDGYVLRASRGGEVSRIYHTPGAVVVAGDPVARVASASAERIVGFLQETQLTDFRVGQRVYVWNRGVPGRRRIQAVVESISPEVQALPARLSAFSEVTVRGRRLMLRIAEPHSLIPGETVEILFDRPTWLQWMDKRFDRLLRSGASSQRETGHAT